ncbi:MAG: hypothetical protein HYZ73_08805 [Elusimicrobia bacterium]|nr:hypothetical protein [Elusimicrobiota bacterium]
MNITRQVAVETWLKRGLNDLVVQFVPLDHWEEYQPFFIHQGLEKVCKAYLIGKNAPSYEHLTIDDARREIDRLARSFRHRLSELVDQVGQYVSGLDAVVGQRYDGYPGRKVLEVLEAGYLESRYPVGEPVNRRFPIPNTDPQLYWDPLYSSALEKCAFAVSRTVVEAAEQEFSVALPRENPYRGRIGDHDWERFSRLFFGREVLCAECKAG